MKFLEVANVGGDITPGATSVGNLLPFPIGMNGSEIIVIKMLRVVLNAITGDVQQLLDWRLIAKRENRNFGVNAGPYFLTNTQTRVIEDNDLLAMGFFGHQLQAAHFSQNIVAPQTVNFPEPHIKLPRAPTLVVRSRFNQTISLTASLYYEKQRASVADVKRLLTRFIGRKQDVVANLPRIIGDEVNEEF